MNDPSGSRLRIVDQVRESLTTLSERPTRTILNIFAVSGGIALAVTTFGFVGAASGQVSTRFDALRATQVVISDREPNSTTPAFAPDTDNRIQSVRGVRSGGVVERWNNQVSVNSTSINSRPEDAATANLVGVTPGALKAMRATVRGLPIRSVDYRNKFAVAVLGSQIAEQIGMTRSLPTNVLIDGHTFTVVGILEKSLRYPEFVDAILIPTTVTEEIWAQGTQRPDRLSEAIIDVAPGAAVQVGHQAPAALGPEHIDRYQPIVPPTPEALRMDVSSDLKNLGFLVGAAGAAIGGIGIANTMLISVLQRSREFGLRRALGARRSHLLRQVVSESGLIGALGGLVGGLFGVMVTLGLTLRYHWTPIIDIRLVGVGLLVGLVTGMVAGIYPALKASRLDPATTLRS